MNILGIIAARGGSKGVPGKNIKLLAGKPLIAYSIEAAKKSRYINKVVVSTEDENIKNVSYKFGADVVDRPEHLATDIAKTAPVIVHAVDELKKQGYIPDIICLLQPTAPLRDEALIDAVLERLIDSKKDSIFVGQKIGINHALWKGIEDKKLSCLYDYHLRPRRQEKELFEDLYMETGSFYALKKEAFNKTQDMLGENVDVYVIDPKECPQIDIDTIEDFLHAEDIILKRQKKNL